MQPLRLALRVVLCCVVSCYVCCYGKGESHKVSCQQFLKRNCGKKYTCQIYCHLHLFICIPSLCVPNPQDSDLLVITILDENDNRPVFTRTSYRAEIMENSAAGNTQCYVCLHISLECLCDIRSRPPEHYA